LLWEDDSLAIAAAWQLACLIGILENEEVLRHFKLTVQQRSQAWHDWVWVPFAEPKESALPVITGRIALRLEQNIENSVTIIPRLKQAVDPRIALPVLLCSEENIRALKNGIHKILDNPGTELSIYLAEIKSKTAGFIEFNLDLHNLKNRYGMKDFIFQVFNLGGNELLKTPAAQLKKLILKTADDLPASVAVLVNGLTPPQFGKLLQAFVSYGRKPKEDWRNSRSVVGYSAETGWHFMLAGIMALLLIASSLYAMGLYCWGNWQYLVDKGAYARVTVFALIVLLIHYVNVIYNDYDSLREKLLWGWQFIAGGTALVIYLLVKQGISLWTDIRSWMMILAISVWGTLFLYFTANNLHQFYSWPWVAALLMAWYGCVIALNLIATQKEHQAKNPLAGII